MMADASVRLAPWHDAADNASMSRDDVEHGPPWGWQQARVARSIQDPSS